LERVFCSSVMTWAHASCLMMSSSAFASSSRVGGSYDRGYQKSLFWWQHGTAVTISRWAWNKPARRLSTLYIITFINITSCLLPYGFPTLPRVAWSISIIEIHAKKH
jgi:cell division protein FtsW (lipid II flippase)